MIVKGQKRKQPPEDVEVSDRESQRQCVFYMSLNKYQRGQELPEPSLRRSVLIANTLRQISLEANHTAAVSMEPSRAAAVSMEASRVAAVSMEANRTTAVSMEVSAVLSTLQERESVLSMAAPNDHSPVAGYTFAASNYQSVALNCVSSRSTASCFSSSNFPSDDDEDWGSISTDPDFSLSAAISSILTALDSTIDGSPQATPRAPLRSMENLLGPTGTPEGGVSWAKQGARSHWVRQEESGVALMSSSYLADVEVDVDVEDLFQDIDTSLLERDMGALGVRGGAGGHLAPAGDDLLMYLPAFPSSSFSSHPFSLSLSQSLKCLPSISSFSQSSSPFSSLSSSPFSTQNHMREGLDLEHLMEILVEA